MTTNSLFLLMASLLVAYVFVDFRRPPYLQHVNPFPLKVVPADAYGPTSIARSFLCLCLCFCLFDSHYISGDGLQDAIAGQDNTFFIGSHDRFENECVKGGASVTAELSSDALEGGSVPVSIEDEGDGTYCGTYPHLTKAGKYTISAKIGDDPVKGSPWTVEIFSAEPSAEHFTWEGQFIFRTISRF